MTRDRKQVDLMELFYRLRWLKRRQLPRIFDDPIEQLRHDRAVRHEIREVEINIEQVMNDERVDPSKREGAGA